MFLTDPLTTLSLLSQVHSRMQGEEKVYLSNDEIDKDDNDQTHYYTTEFLNRIRTSTLPPHQLKLKKGSVVMLLRNLDVSSGLRNGTRLEVGCFYPLGTIFIRPFRWTK